MARDELQEDQKESLEHSSERPEPIPERYRYIKTNGDMVIYDSGELTSSDEPPENGGEAAFGRAYIASDKSVDLINKV